MQRSDLGLTLRARVAFATAVIVGGIVLGWGRNAYAQAPAQDSSGPVPWRVECTGDGKTLDCRAVQQIAQRDARQQIVPLATAVVRYAPDTKTAVMQILLPLGLNLTEPILIKVDNGAPEKQSIQTCNNAGCLVSMTVSDRLLAAMRTGTDLKITVQDANKKPADIALPLLGFGVAYDKVK
jgi:invasion protein IalB